MLQLEVTAEDFAQLCEDEDIQPSPRYSGRGMYGAECIGIVGKGDALMKFVLRILPQIDPNYDFESTLHTSDEVHVVARAEKPDISVAFSEEWLRMNQDNMGMDLIYYWPEIQIGGAE